jgi:hypothetical protein
MDPLVGTIGIGQVLTAGVIALLRRVAGWDLQGATQKQSSIPPQERHLRQRQTSQAKAAVMPSTGRG